MKRTTLYLLSFLIFCFFQRCKKSDPPTPAPVPTAAALLPGHCVIRFQTDAIFTGTTLHEFGTTKDSLADFTNVRNQLTGQDQFILAMALKQVNGLTSLNQCYMGIFPGASQTLRFSDSSTNQVTFGFTNMNVAGNTLEGNFRGQSGTLTITKLTATELEASFSVTAVDKDKNHTLQITNGELYARFQ